MIPSPRQFLKGAIKRVIFVISIFPFIFGIILAILLRGENPYHEGPSGTALLLGIMWACVFFVMVWLCYFAVLWAYFLVRWIMKDSRDKNNLDS